MTERVADSERVRAAPERARWAFLIVVAVGVAVTVAINLGRLPTGARGYYNRGVADMRLGRFGAAIENLDRAVEMEPGYVDAHIARANVWTRDGHPYRALVEADAALRLDEGDAKARYIRGVALRQLGRYDAALESFDEALRDDVSLGKAVLAEANLLFDLGALDGALAGYQHVWRLRRNDEGFYFAPLAIWATETLLGGRDAAVVELDERVRGSLADRTRLAPYVVALKGDSSGDVEASTNDDERDAIMSWIVAIRLLADGKRPEAIEGLRAALAKSPEESWVRERARSILEVLTVGLRAQPDDPEISSSLSFGPGLSIAWVRKDGAAAVAGLTVDDRLLRVGGRDASVDALDAIVEKGTPGSEVVFDLDRNGTAVAVKVVLGGGNAFTPGASSPTR